MSNISSKSLIPSIIFFLFSFTSICHSQIIITVAGNGGFDFSDDTIATACSISPDGIYIDDAENLYIVDGIDNRICKLSFTTGILTTIAGEGAMGYSGDGELAIHAQLRHPLDIIGDKYGNIFIADAENNRIRIIGPDGIIKTYAGTGIYGTSGDGGAATSANIGSPSNMAFDPSGNLYFIDVNAHIRKIDASTGIMSMIVGMGSPGYSGDGEDAKLAALNVPLGIVFDYSGNLFIADAGNKVIRRVDAVTNIITTYAGNRMDTTISHFGDGVLALDAELKTPSGLVVDSLGNLFICDWMANAIRKINLATNTIYNFAGNGVQGFSGDEGPAVNAELNYPQRLAFDKHHNLYISDALNNRVRKVIDTLTTPYLSTHNITTATCTLSPNPTTNTTHLHLSNEGDYTITLINMTGQTIATQYAHGTDFNIDLSTQASGVYILQVKGDGVFTKQLVKN